MNLLSCDVIVNNYVSEISVQCDNQCIALNIRKLEKNNLVKTHSRLSGHSCYWPVDGNVALYANIIIKLSI